jgi:putative transposase
MTLFRNKYRVETARLVKWDYSTPGFYFVTVCSHERRCMFGEIINGEMRMNDKGRIINDEWIKTFALRCELKQDEFVVMPNHFHAIIRIVENGGFRQRICRDVARYVSTTTTNNSHIKNQNPNPQTRISAIPPKPNSLAAVIRSFKSAVTNRIHGVGFVGVVWQPRFYDHIVRDNRELFAIRQYIKNNPAHWSNDRNVIEASRQNGGRQPWFVYMG